MTIDGKENVKKRIEIFKNKYYTTYKYIFENDNSYNDTVPKWKQKDFKNNICMTEEKRIENKLDKMVYRR